MPQTKVRSYAPLALEVLAVILLGLMAGFFFAFAVDVVPAMANLDAAGYVTTQQWINRVVRNALFGGVYFGSTVLPFVVAAALFWSASRRHALGWMIIAVVYFAAVFWITRSVNVPINNELAAWSPLSPPANWVQARDDWNESNLVRAVAACLCFMSSVVLVATRRFRGAGA